MTVRVGAVFAPRPSAGVRAGDKIPHPPNAGHPANAGQPSDGAGPGGDQQPQRAGAGEPGGDVAARSGERGESGASVERDIPGGAVPPGVDRDEFRLALLEDTYEVVAGLELVRPALILADGDWPAAEAVTWPGTPIVHAGDLAAALERLRDLGAEQTVVVAGDAPDLPPLLIGKLFRALGHAQAAVCPSDGGGLVALAVPLPAPSWLFHGVAGSGFELFDLSDAFRRLRAAAPRSGLVQAGPGWHRLRVPGDLALLDPGLEGWESTRALLSGRPLR